MPIEFTWYGHATWLLNTGNHKILIDPFFVDNPSTDVSPDDVDVDFICVSHGHGDHIADCAAIANRTGAPVISIFEITNWLTEKHGVQNCIGGNIGGTIKQDFGSVKLTNAIHSSQLPDGSYGGNPAGLLFELDGFKAYFACDTALFSDMSLIGEVGIDVAVLPIGDHFTMGIEDSVLATKLVNPKSVLPTHYNTWPPIAQDANGWAELIRKSTSAEPIVLEPGGTHQF